MSIETIGFFTLLVLALVAIALIRGNRPRVAKSRSVEPPASFDPSGKYKQKPLLTPWERRALLALREQIPPGFYVCPQVRLADMLSVGSGADLRTSVALSKITRKSVDFAIIELSSGSVRLVVELDDRTHDRADRKDRDRFVDGALRTAGVPIARFRPNDRLDVRGRF